MKKEILLPLLIGSDKDLPYAQSIKKLFDGANSSLVNINIIVDIRIASVHKCCEYFIKAVQEYEKDDNVICYIGVAGKSNALAPTLDGLTTRPVISSPPYKVSSEVDIHSCISLPSGISPLLILGPDNTFLAVLKIIASQHPEIRKFIAFQQNENRQKLRILDITNKYYKTTCLKLDLVVDDTIKFIRSGKSRDLYVTDKDNELIIRASNRLSAFNRNICDIDYKGAVLTNITTWWFDKTAHIVPNHFIEREGTTGIKVKKTTPFAIEFIVRGYLAGTSSTSIWTAYNNGERSYCGHSLSDNLVKNQKLESPIVTPTTKGDIDELITSTELVERGTITQEQWNMCEEYALQLFKFGEKLMREKGLILVDTKYEFGLDENNNIILIDEIHTPDSSRYWIKHSYTSKLMVGEEPESIDKDIIRKYLNKNAENTTVIPADLLKLVSQRYQQLNEIITGETL